MEAGKLRHRVDVQSLTRGQNGFGEATMAWSTVAVRWASVEPVAGKEIMVGDQPQPQVTHRVCLRWMAGITSDCRLIHQGRAFNISAVMDKDERRRELELLCIEAGPA